MRRGLAALAVVVLACCGPASPPPRAASSTPPRRSRPAPPIQANEAPVPGPLLHEERNDSRIVTVQVAFPAGSSSDPEGRRGLTRLVGRLMSRAHRGRLYLLSATLAVDTDRDGTVFEGRVHRDRLEPFTEIFREALLRPVDAEGVYGVRAQLRSELARERHDPEQVAWQALHAMLYEGHPYEHPPAGSAGDLARITLDDVRAHRARFFCGERAIVRVAGDYPDGFAERLAADVARLPGGACAAPSALPRVEPRSRVWFVEQPGASGVDVWMGIPLDIDRRHPDHPALQLAAAALGGPHHAARLHQELRVRRGLTYATYAGAPLAPRGAPPEVLRRQEHLSVRIAALSEARAHLGVGLALRELRRWVAQGLDQAELERARDVLEHAIELSALRDRRRLRWSVDPHAPGAAPFSRLPAAWRALTPERVNDALRRHVDLERLQIVIVSSDAAGLVEHISGEELASLERARSEPREAGEEVPERALGWEVPRVRVVRASEDGFVELSAP